MSFLQRRTLTSQVVDHILAQIKRGDFKAGDKLPTEKQLTQELKVSRTCVREAMKSLESLGVVRTRPRIGAVVQQPTPASIFNAEQFSHAILDDQTDKLLEFRMIVEVGIASLAAERADRQDWDAMQNALDRYRAEMEAGNSVDCQTDMAFHAALAAASKNPLGQSVWRMISARLAEVLEKNSVLPDVYPNTLRDHLRIFRAIKEGHPRKAGHAMRQHLENTHRITRLALYEGATQGKDK